MDHDVVFNHQFKVDNIRQCCIDFRVYRHTSDVFRRTPVNIKTIHSLFWIHWFGSTRWSRDVQQNQIGVVISLKSDTHSLLLVYISPSSQDDLSKDFVPHPQRTVHRENSRTQESENMNVWTYTKHSCPVVHIIVERLVPFQPAVWHCLSSCHCPFVSG
jgi:hypothetical protein